MVETYAFQLEYKPLYINFCWQTKITEAVSAVCSTGCELLCMRDL